jgi:hypothetical protein
MVEIVIRPPDGTQEEVDWAFCLDDLIIEFLDRRLDENYSSCTVLLIFFAAR